MNSNPNFPTIDHLIEGVHYRIVDWDFAQQAPARPQAAACEEGEKMVFGICRKLKDPSKAKDDRDFDSEKRTKQEESLERASGKGVKTKEEAVAANKKGFETSGKKYGWAIKGGKPVIVEWGSVAGAKKAPETGKQSKAGVK
jgi:hypothetical protein